MNLDEYLHVLDARFDQEARMPWCHASGPGYHTLIPAGSRAHSTKEAADYALALLQNGSAERIQRAQLVLDALIAQQVTDPLAVHYGLWGWFLEEPPQQMSPADWNWADFIGVRLAQGLAVHGGQLEAGLAEGMRTALGHAAMAIFRRNTDADYTNIAVMGAVACAAAGEILGTGLLLDFATRRLDEVLSRFDVTGGFTEYNSPAYNRVVLEELERAALMVRDKRFGDIAAALRERTWRALADRFHPGTGQLAGPMSRAYDDWLTPDVAEYLAGQAGTPIAAHAGTAQMPFLVPPLPCPPDIVRRFHELPSSTVEVASKAGASWLSEDACLGTAAEEIAWTQRRPLLGYWRTPDDPAVVLRARMLLDGRDLSAARCRQTQNGPRVLSAWWLTYDSGDFHPVLDRPPGSVFDVVDLRLAVTLRGRGVEALDLANGRFALRAGGWQAVVHTLPAEFMGESVSWQIANEVEEARIEAVLAAGDRRAIDFHHATLSAAFALEIVPVTESASTAGLERPSDVDDQIRWRWGHLAVTAPARPTSFLEDENR